MFIFSECCYIQCHNEQTNINNQLHHIKKTNYPQTQVCTKKRIFKDVIYVITSIPPYLTPLILIIQNIICNTAQLNSGITNKSTEQVNIYNQNYKETCALDTKTVFDYSNETIRKHHP